MNKIILTNLYLADDVQVSEGNTNGNNYKRASFSAFLNYFKKNEKQSELIRGTVWGNNADSIRKAQTEGKFLKGCRVEICGEAHIGSYTDKNGKVNTYIEVSNIDNFRSDPHKDFVPGQMQQAAPYQGQGYQSQSSSQQAYPQQQGYPRQNSKGYNHNGNGYGQQNQNWQEYGQQDQSGQGYGQQYGQPQPQNYSGYKAQESNYGQQTSYAQRAKKPQEQMRPQGGYTPAANGGMEIPRGGFVPAGVTAPTQG